MKVEDFYNELFQEIKSTQVAEDEGGNQEQIFTQMAIDYLADAGETENARVSYPIYHIDNIVKPISKAGHANKVILLTADAFGVLPPVAKLTPEQTEYYFLSGFTAKLAGTERGITEPEPTFSSCFGAAFLTLHPTIYANVLQKRMKAANAEAYLVNTGWNGLGKRISIKDTRAIINAILNDEISRCGVPKDRPKIHKDDSDLFLL